MNTSHFNTGWHLWPVINQSPQLHLTSIQAAGHVVALAGGAFEERSRSDDLRAGPAGLSLRSAAVAKLGAEAQELLRGCLRGHEPVASYKHSH